MVWMAALWHSNMRSILADREPELSIAGDERAMLV
jgi:hypothetical protein